MTKNKSISLYFLLKEKSKTVNFIHKIIVVVLIGERGRETGETRRKKMLKFLRFCDVYNSFLCVFYGFALSLAGPLNVFITRFVFVFNTLAEGTTIVFPSWKFIHFLCVIK